MPMTKPAIPAEYGSLLGKSPFGISAPEGYGKPEDRAVPAEASSGKLPRPSEVADAAATAAAATATAGPASTLKPARKKSRVKSLAGNISALAMRTAWALPFPIAVLALWWVASSRGWAP